MSPPVVDLRSAHVRFGRGTPNEVVALSGVDLTLERGDYVAVVGSNGAGKSTLLDVLAGSVALDSGSVWFDGDDVSSLPDYRRAAFTARVFQNPLAGTCPSLSVEENLVLASTRGQRRGFGLGVTHDRRRDFSRLLSDLGLGLESRMSELVEALSGGQRQCLTVLMASMVAPNLFLLDEHTAALDPRMQREVMRLTDETIKAGRLTTLMVTHNLQNAVEFGTRLVMMHKGRVVVSLDAAAKGSLQVPDLLSLFDKHRAEASDSMVLDDGM